tara:strand:+ start:162 stop:443 length:282 start_codon:yes stop_codon:yes gene_type:complete
VVEPSIWSYFWILFIIGLLVVGLLLVRRFDFKISSFVDGKNIKLMEYSNLGDGVKALLLESHGHTYMCIITRNACSNLIKLEKDKKENFEGCD